MPPPTTTQSYMPPVSAMSAGGWSNWTSRTACAFCITRSVFPAESCSRPRRYIRPTRRYFEGRRRPPGYPQRPSTCRQENRRIHVAGNPVYTFEPSRKAWRAAKSGKYPGILAWMVVRGTAQFGHEVVAIWRRTGAGRSPSGAPQALATRSAVSAILYGMGALWSA